MAISWTLVWVYLTRRIDETSFVYGFPFRRRAVNRLLDCLPVPGVGRFGINVIARTVAVAPEYHKIRIGTFFEGRNIGEIPNGGFCSGGDAVLQGS